MSEQQRLRRPAFKRFDRADHGTRTCYGAGCRCDECRDAEGCNRPMRAPKDTRRHQWWRCADDQPQAFRCCACGQLADLPDDSECPQPSLLGDDK